MPGLDPNALHLINGDVAAGTFRQAIANTRRLVISRDLLSCGPTPAFTDMESWTRMRIAFWAEVVQSLPAIDIRQRQTDLSQNVDALVEAGHIYAWAAGGSTDQLMVAFLFELLERRGADPGKVQLLEFSTVPGGRRILQMGELDAAQMRLHPPPRSLTMEEWVAYRQAWRALTADDPRKPLAFEVENPEAPAPLKFALRNLLTRYPDRVTGLPLWDRRLLQNVRAHGPRAARIIGYTLGERLHEGDLASDLYFFWRLVRMASPRLPRPLLVAIGDSRTMADANFELTEFGAQVAEGKASSWPTNPIDEWVGGVHLSSTQGTLWFNESETLVRG